MLAMKSWAAGGFFLLAIFAAAATSIAQTTRKPAAVEGAKTPPKPLRNNMSAVRKPGDSMKVAQRSDARPAPIDDTVAQDAPAPRDPKKRVQQIASLTPEEIKARQSTTPLRRSVTVYVPKLVMERQNVARTIMAPVTSQELRPVWSPGANRWLTYQQTGHTMWSQRVEVAPMDVPVWKYVAETRYIDEPVVRQNFYAPIQTAPNAYAAGSAWAWKQPGPGVQPVIPPYQAPSSQRPVLSFLQNRPLVGRFFGGNRPAFPPAPAPLATTTANYQPTNYQPVSLYAPNFSTPNYASPVAGNGIPAFSAPALPTSGSAGAFGGVRTFQ